jgi:signal transduction histidine kinase
VVIEEVRIDDELVEENVLQAEADASEKNPVTASPSSHYRSPITLLANQRRVEFRFAGLSFMAPAKVRFRYRMEGFDPDWVNGGTARSVSYTRLPPGHYRFCVTARNNDGLWNETGASLAVTVLAPWYRTWWAVGLAILAGAGLIASFYERRLHRLRRARALQEGFSRQLIASQEAERRRLAGELHDSLGQELLLIKNHAVLALDVPDAGRAIKDQIEDISVAATRAIDTARAMAHALGPYELKQLGLAGALQSMINRITDATGLEFHCQFDDLSDALGADQEIALYRILQESLNNVVKHAQAHEVFLEIQRSADRLTVRLQDDGCGFETNADGRAKSAGGHGLPGIYERAHLAGGHARIHSAPDHGTVLTLELPLMGSSDQHEEK